MPARPAKIISEQRVFKRFHAMDILEVEPPSLRHDGMAAPMTREVMRIGRVGAILLYDPEGDRILLNQQFRIAPCAARDQDPFLFECAMGFVEEGEEPEASVRREAVEETGCAVSDIVHVGDVYPSPGSLEERFFLYVGRISNPVEGFHGLESEAEEIRTHLFPAEKVFEMVDNNQIRNGMSALLVNWFARHRARLRREWLGSK